MKSRLNHSHQGYGRKYILTLFTLSLVLTLALIVLAQAQSVPDPGHGASQIGSGSFSSGDYQISGSLNMTGNLTIGSDPVNPHVLINRTAVTVFGQNGQSNAFISARGTGGGNSFEWGHGNTAGYGSTLGLQTGGGTPFICFMCESGTTANTFRTRGNIGSLYYGGGGGFGWSKIPTATADNQASTSLMTLSSSGNLNVNPTAGTQTAFIGSAFGGSSAYAGITLNGLGESSTGYNMISGSGDQTLYINVPSGNVIRFRVANADSAVASSTRFSVAGTDFLDSSASTVSNCFTVSSDSSTGQYGICGSDARLKENVRQIGDGLAVMRKFNPVVFDWINGTKNQTGFIGQEAQQILPAMVGNYTGYLTFSPTAVVAHAVGAIKELDEQLKVLKAENAALKALVCQDHPSAEVCA